MNDVNPVHSTPFVFGLIRNLRGCGYFHFDLIKYNEAPDAVVGSDNDMINFT
jgi:hypothetical protein